jgi:membrane peptidoglycan carboxypeptidase
VIYDLASTTEGCDKIISKLISKMTSKKKKILIIAACVIFLIPVSYIGYEIFCVTRDASIRIERGAIDRIFSSESSVYYDDGKTPIGVFFDKTHCKYITYKEIPKAFIKALVAAEDADFFRHGGVDIKAIFRAFIANIRSRKVVQGGSTITQQAAKNIFKREKRSYMAKLRELFQAFLLERKYTKEEILEMYANQFFVTGYGNGLGIAAQCFFDKDARDLDLIEAAFIAGSVKGPNRYNPFIKKNEEEQKKARQLAKERKDYVLTKMLDLNFITRDQYTEAKEKAVPFKEGRISYRLNVIMDYIRDQLESDYFRTILKEQGIENAESSGISVYTSINKEIQEATLTSLRTHLPLMDARLSGYTVSNVPEKYWDLFKLDTRGSASSLPFLAKITQISIDKDNCRISVQWDDSHEGVIDEKGVKPMAGAWLKWKQGQWAVLNKTHIRSFLGNFKQGDIVPVQLVQTAKGATSLCLSKIPELEGGMIVLHKGMVKAMVGGFLDRFFNRAVDAKRQLGSIVKPIVYTSALQLKWNSLDPLRNVSDTFQFENTYYQPRPDHTPASDTVSMAWAGAKSENLATVWLLYHLTDQLNKGEFNKVMQSVGLDRKETESYLDYKKKIRDKYGIIVNSKVMMEAAFEKSKKDIEPDIIFGNYEEILTQLKWLNLDLDTGKPDPNGPGRYSFKRLCDLNTKMKRDFTELVRSLEKIMGQAPPPAMEEGLSWPLSHFYRTISEQEQERIIYTEDPTVLYPPALLPVTAERAVNREVMFKSEDVWVDGLFPSEILDLVQRKTSENLRTMLTCKRYDPNGLYWVRDFRTLVNLLYLVNISKKIGISTELDPVLSLALGSSSISLTEAALAYQTIMTGQVYPIDPGAELTMVPIITKIVDRDGEILWEYEPKPARMLSNTVSGQVTEILRKVMEEGTGQKAKNAVSISGIPIPSFGKTGTSNRYTNSSFVGFIPGPNKKTGQLDLQEGYVIASYVGFDDNRPMKSRHWAIYGASGALPLWTDTAAAIVNTDDYKRNIRPADLAFEPLSGLFSEKDHFLAVSVCPYSGLPDSSEQIELSHEVLADAVNQDGKLLLKRHFEPFSGVIQ